MGANEANSKNDGKVKKVRPRGKKSSRKFKQAYEKLPNYKFWDEVIIRLTAGEACYSIARWWKSKGEFASIGVKTLSKYLGQYRIEKIPDQEMMVGVGPAAIHYINKLVQKYSAEIDVFKELSVLINLQKKRLGQSVEKEETIKFPLEMTNKIAEQYHNLLKDLFDFQVKTGRLPQVPQRFDHRFSSSGDNGGREDSSVEIKNRKEEIQKRRRVAELALTLIRLSSERANQEKQKVITQNTNKRENND